MAKLNRRDYGRLKPGETITDAAGKGVPSLRARGAASGHPRCYLRYTDSKGRRDDLPIGAFADPEEAEAKAAALVKRWRDGDRDLRAVLEAERLARERAAAAAVAQAAAEAARERATLERLCECYADHLESRGKSSAPQVRRTLARVLGDLPLWRTPASDVTGEDVARVLSALVKGGKLREAAKVRSYLRAAFRLAAGARLDPNAGPELRELGITADPLANVPAIQGAIKARDRALIGAELRLYWDRIAAMPGPDGALLRAHLLAGAQRVEQLARATVRDWDREAQVLTLRDPKGRRTEARIHRVPVIAAAASALEAMNQGLGPYVFSIDGGASPAPYAAVQHRVRKVAEAMVADGASAEPFTAGDLRRSVESVLAKQGVPLEVRAYLQSHGLGGVQARHYVRADFDAEMRDALERLHRLLTGGGGRVLPMRRGRA